MAPTCYSIPMRPHLQNGLLVILTILLAASCLWAGELKEFKGVRYVPDASNDGDSFLVSVTERGGKKEYRVRLYFVDCPETTAGSKTDAQRVREQTRHFGLESASETVKFGAEATEFTRKALGKPFTMHTSFASALGRSKGGRVYAFITTSTGEDLARLLVTNGYARTLGVYRKTPEGVHHKEMKKQLEDLELGAAIKLVGIWEETDPDRLAKLRKKQRQEDEELKRVQEEARRPSKKKVTEKQPPVDINKATKLQLRTIRGIGEKKSQAIINGRPYKRMDDVDEVKGIGSEMLKRLRARFYVPQG